MNFCTVAAELKKPLIEHTMLSHQGCAVHFAHQLVQPSTLPNQLQGAIPSTEPALFISLFNLFESLALMLLPPTDGCKANHTLHHRQKICNILVETLKDLSLLRKYSLSNEYKVVLNRYNTGIVSFW